MGMSLRAALLVALGAALAMGCSATTEGVGTGEDAVGTDSFKLATFNAGLVRGGVALADERLPLIAPALEATGADVLCLQEVWSDADYERIRSQLAGTYAHAFRERTEEDGKRWFACGALKLNSLSNCVDDKCTPSGISAEECVDTVCKDKYDRLSDGCKTCLAANTDAPTKCLFRADEYVQDGRNGLALFSKHPIEAARFEAFGTALVHRGMIRADVQGRAIVCTHLSSDLTTVPYPSGHAWSSWRDEQAAQVDKVTASLPSTGCRVVMGDLNTSPDQAPLRPELPETLAAFSQKGFRSPGALRTCTWCPPPTNPLASGREEKTYDHVLVNGCGTPRYERIMDEPVEVTLDGKPLTTRLSDHFGLMATFK
jgi:endonuclease/exonuclease/phosphatase family metal-dependent hydrolase